MNREPAAAPRAGLLILNADDWGRDAHTTGQILACFLRRSLSSASAMVFMKDSERAAAIARERGLDTGLHLNFTTPFSAPCTPGRLAEHQRRLGGYLGRHRLAPAVFHPGLAGSFRYVAEAQREEFARLYGDEPTRIDGHHHMHLCANVLFAGLLPPGAVVRRNFSFQRGEKSLLNRLYRRGIDRVLARRHAMTDFFFSLPPLEPPARLANIFSLARKFTVEVETHPVNPAEYRFLAGGELSRLMGGIPIAPRYSLPGKAPIGEPRLAEPYVAE
jgi:hypothetical protein